MLDATPVEVNGIHVELDADREKPDATCENLGRATSRSSGAASGSTPRGSLWSTVRIP